MALSREGGTSEIAKTSDILQNLYTARFYFSSARSSLKARIIPTGGAFGWLVGQLFSTALENAKSCWPAHHSSARLQYTRGIPFLATDGKLAGVNT
jgi:hypothetical protein